MPSYWIPQWSFFLQVMVIFNLPLLKEPDNQFDRQLILILYLVWFLYCGRE